MTNLSIVAPLHKREPIRMLVLGAPVLVHDSGRLPFVRERRFQLLALLAHEGKWVSRERLATLLWPDATVERGRSNLRKVLFDVRQARELAHIHVEDEGGALRWQVATDLEAYESALAAGDFAAAVALWRGEPWKGLAGSAKDGFDGWLHYERQRLRGSWRDALLRLSASEPDAARQSAWADRLLADEPLDEEAVQLKMRACARSGQPAEVARVYRLFAKALAEAAGIEPSPSTQALLQPAVERTAAAIAAGGASPAAVAFDPDFTGRLVEQRELAALLARAECRWVTLLGPGGIGKTRFLAHVLPSLAPAFAEGALYVPLDDLNSAEQVLPRLAQHLGLRLDADELPVAQLQRALRGRRLLLGLDNLEHVRAAAPALSELLQACPELRVVATSRERAEVAGEWPMVLDGLPFPEPDDSDRAEAFDAVRLFLRRALAIQPRFDLNRERRDVVELCAVVEGMPLALELAAVWTRHFTVAEIVRDLKASGAMLIEPQGGRLPRHQSIAFTFEHSWRLLAAAEREALMRMSVFAGGFTSEAAQWVAGASLGVLTALIDKSLLRKSSAGGAARFGFHPLLQQLVASRLDEQPALREETTRRHADFYCRLLGRYQGGTPAKAWVTEADVEAENIFQAWNHVVRSSETALLAEALMGFVSHAYRTGQWEPGLAALDAAVSLEPLSAYQRARVQTYRAVLQLNLGFDKQAARGTQEALDVLRSTQDRRALQSCLYYLGMARLSLGELAIAESCLNESLALARAVANQVGIQSCLNGLIDALRAAGRYDDAIDMAKVADMDEEWWMGQVADFHRLAGRPAQALRLLEAPLTEPPPSSYDSYLLECRWMVLQTAAAAHLDLGDLDAAERLAELALAVQQELGRGVTPILTLPTCLLRSRLAWLRGDARMAHRLLAEASTIAGRHRSHQQLVRVAVHWARLLAAFAEHDLVRRIVRIALSEPTTGAETRRIAVELGCTDASVPPDDGEAAFNGSVSTAELLLLVRHADVLSAALLPTVPAHASERRCPT